MAGGGGPALGSNALCLSAGIGSCYHVGMKRRALLKGGLALAGLAASAGVSGCAQLQRPAAQRASLSPTLKIFHWSEYIAGSVVKKFEEEFSVKLLLEFTTNNEQIRDAIAADPGGAHGYDLIVIADYMVAAMIAGNQLETIDFSNVPNAANISPRNRNLYYDPTGAFSLPYFWGTTGVLYDPARVPAPILLWKQMLNPAPQLTGRIAMLDDARETLATALRVLGHSGSSDRPAEIDAAKALLLEQRRSTANYDAPQTNSQRVLAGELAAGVTYTNNAMAARRARPELRYALPDPVTTVWQDNLAIPRGAPNKRTAEVFIDFMLRPDVAAANASEVGAASPNALAVKQKLITETLTSDPAIYPELVGAGGKFEWLLNLQPEVAALYDTAFAEVKRG